MRRRRAWGHRRLARAALALCVLLPLGAIFFVPRVRRNAPPAVDDDSLLHQLLRRVAIGDARSRRVVLFAFNFAYRELALNFVCSLRRLHIQNYLAVALDQRAYHFLAARAVPVVLLPGTGLYHDGHEAVFGSQRFVTTSLQKSRLVLRVLRLGYDVLFSDVDVALLRDPRPPLRSYAADVVIQSDRPASHPHLAPNYNINSGLYFVRSNPRSVAAFAAIVNYAAAIRRSEQKAFNYVLCGAFKQHRAGPGVRLGSRRCMHLRSRATVAVLPLDAFPNGSNASFWLHSTEPLSNAYPRALCMHVNYVSGCQRKIQRLARLGMWLQCSFGSTADT